MNQQTKQVVDAYEQRFGVVAPIIIANIEKALMESPLSWVLRAVQTAEPRRWGEVNRLLSQWQRDGHLPDDETAVVSKQWADLIRQVTK